MRKIVYTVSEDYERRTGGWIYNENLLRELGRLGHPIERLVLPGGFPNPSDTAVAATGEIFARIPDDTLVLVDQICLGVLPALAAVQGTRLRLAMIVHHPIAFENESDKAASEELFASEKAVLVHVRHAIVTSLTTCRALVERYGVPAEKIICAEPGSDRRAVSQGSTEGPLRLLSVGALVPRKGQDVLLSAMAGLTDLPWSLTIVGNTNRDRQHLGRIRQILDRNQLRERACLVGELSQDDLDELWQTTDLFVSASRHEGYGMAVAEAIARGIPVVTTRAGAVGEWISPDAALVVPNGDVQRLCRAIRSVMENCVLRQNLRAGALAQRKSLPEWTTAARKVSVVVSH